MPNSHLNKTQVQEVAIEFQRIENKYGGTKPAHIVKEARDPNSSLHDYFTWDDSAAAENWRLVEAQTLARSIRLVQVGIPLAEQPIIRAFVNVKAHDKEDKFEGHAYISFARVLEDESYTQQMLDSAKEALRNFQRKYEDLLLFTGAMESVEKAQSKLTKKNLGRRGKNRLSRSKSG